MIVQCSVAGTEELNGKLILTLSVAYILILDYILFLLFSFLARHEVTSVT